MTPNSMESRRGRIIALSLGFLGLTGLGAASFAFRERIYEEYCLWNLELGNESARGFAARRLGEIRSLRAVAGLLKWVGSAKRRPGDIEGSYFASAPWPSQDVPFDVSMSVYEIVKSSFLRMGEIAAPKLTELSGEQNGDRFMRFWAKAMLGELEGEPIVYFVEIQVFYGQMRQ